MAQYGETGSVLPKMVSASSYGIAKAKHKRVALACFLCGLAACVSVTLIAFALGFTLSLVDGFSGSGGDIFSGRGFEAGMGLALIVSAMNWWVCYITVPAAWVALGLSIGRFPRRGILRPAPYYRWGTIWGTSLVGITCLVFSAMTRSGGAEDGFSFIFGATLTGGLIGALAGLSCGWLFLAIVKPAEQVRQLNIDVF